MNTYKLHTHSLEKSENDADEISKHHNIHTFCDMDFISLFCFCLLLYTPIQEPKKMKEIKTKRSNQQQSLSKHEHSIIIEMNLLVWKAHKKCIKSQTNIQNHYLQSYLCIFIFFYRLHLLLFFFISFCRHFFQNMLKFCWVWNSKQSN